MNYKRRAALLLSFLFIANIAIQGPIIGDVLTFPSSTFASRIIATPQKRVLAILNDQKLTLDDVDLKARQAVEELETKLAQIRRDILVAQINSILLDMAATQRKVTADQFYDIEIAGHVIAPTKEEIEADYRAHPELYGKYELWLVRDRIEGKLRDQQEKKLLEDWTVKQQQQVRMVKNIDVNNPNLKPGSVLATVGGYKVTLGSLSERLKPRIFQARLESYELVRDALNQAINDLLLKTEAKKRSVTPDDLIRTEITEKTHPPSEEEIKKYYEANSWRFNDLASARTKMVSELQQQQLEGLRKALNERLRAAASIRILINEPEPPVQTISNSSSPIRGNPSAPVTVVEFGDFQCYPCGQMHPIVEEALKPFGEKVRFVFRQYPMSMHRHSRKAAEAALAANEQGKFWEYAALLFKNQRALNTQSLKKYAIELGLDGERFNRALDDGLFAAEVRRDMREGEIYGVDIIGTPTYFINGVRLPLTAYNLEGVRKAIEDALAKSNQVKK